MFSGVKSTGRKKRFVFLNMAAEQDLGFELVLERTHPEDRVRVQQAIDRASQDAKDFDLEHRLLMPDGSVKHVHVVGHLLETGSTGQNRIGRSDHRHYRTQTRGSSAAADRGIFRGSAKAEPHRQLGLERGTQREHPLVARVYRLFGLDPQKRFSVLRNIRCSVFIPRTGLLSIKPKRDS
jgi:hypothetical protein